MIIEAREIPDGTRLEVDLCVIGGGAAGIALARQFLGRTTSVLVLESGGRVFDPRAQALAEGTITGVPNIALDEARLRMFGGSTNHWGGVCRPMEPEDFAPRSWVPGSGWPIGYGEVEPYYEPAREVVGLGPGSWRLDDWELRDLRSTLPLDEARAFTRMVRIVGRTARSFSERYGEELEASANVRFLLEATVREIQVDASGRTVTGLDVARYDGGRFTVAARAYVLATGGVENPRLLLASNRARGGVGNEHDVVGRYFTDHPRFVGAMLLPASTRLALAFYDDHVVAEETVRGYLSIPRAVQEREGILDVQILVREIPDRPFELALRGPAVDAAREIADGKDFDDLGDLARHLGIVLEDITTGHGFLAPGAPLPIPHPALVAAALARSSDAAPELIPDALGSVAAAGWEKTFGAPLLAAALRPRIDPVPNPDSRIVLTDDADEFGMPRIAMDWRLSDLDRHSVARTLELYAEELGRQGLGRVQILFDPDAPWPDDIAGGWHHMGTTRMSDDPRTGVVDRDCRMHGVDNLWVAGSSVFSSAGSGSPTLTLVALALRLADHLRDQLA